MDRQKNPIASRLDSLSPVLDRLFEEEIERFHLPNGMLVLLKEERGCGLASVQVWVASGSMHEGPKLGCGLSHFLEHMLFKGTDRFPGSEVSRVVQAAGGYINAYTTFDRTVYYIELPAEGINQALEVLSDAVFHAQLPEAEVEKEREVILREIDMGLDDPERQVVCTMFENAFRAHPYRLPVIGHRELFESVSGNDLRAYYQGHYVPDNMTLVIVGDFRTDVLRSSVSSTFGEARRGRRPPPFIPLEPSQLARREEHRFGDVNVCRGGIAFKIPGLAHGDAPGIDMWSSILGDGLSSILYRRLRDERNLVHSIDATSWNPGRGGLFWISYTCTMGKREEAQCAILEELESVRRESVSYDLLEKARHRAVVGEINTRKTVGGQASRLGVAEVVVGDLDYPRNYFGQLRALTCRDLEEIMGTYFTSDSLTAVSLNSEQVRPAPKRSLAPAKGLQDFTLHGVSGGGRIVFQHDGRLPKVCVRLVGLGGPLYEADSVRGVTGIMATLLARDTERRDRAEVAAAIEQVGGVFGEFVGNNSFGLSVEVMPGDFPLAVDLLEEAVLSPAFVPATFEREREAQIASIKEDLDDIVEFGRKRLRRHFFGDHPYASDAYGTEDTLSAVTLEQVVAHYRELVVAQNVVICIAGDIDGDRAVPALEALLRGLPTSPFSRRNPPFSGPPETVLYHETLPREQAVVFQAYPDVGVAHERFIIGESLEEICSEMSGRLFSRVREELSLAYFVGASRVTGVNAGMFYFFAGTLPGQADRVLREFSDEVARLRLGDVAAEELERCKNRLKAQKRIGLQTIGARSMHAALNETYGLPLNDWKDYDERVDAIDLVDLGEFATQYFRQAQKIRLVVNDGAATGRAGA